MEQWAILSVSDKTGLKELATWFQDQGIGLLASGGTYRHLVDQGLAARSLEDLTGFAQILGGRVKTLHPRIYAGILSRETPEDLKDRQQIEAPKVVVVVVNLYPFRQRLESGASQAELIEEIDIGGVSLIRGAAKNFSEVAVLVDPRQYRDFMKTPLADLTVSDRMTWAREAFRHVAAYDTMIANAFDSWQPGDLAEEFVWTGTKTGTLRYGENPHQKAGFYTMPGQAGFSGAQLYQGKLLSYNNYADSDTAWGLVRTFERPTAVAVKHQTPCGVGISDHIEEAFRKAREADPISIFGGIVAFNRTVNGKTASLLGDLFLEVVLAPEFSPEALDLLSRKKNLRLLKMPDASWHPYDIKTVDGGFLVQERDYRVIPFDEFKHVGGPRADWHAKHDDAEVAWNTVGWVKSNAIVVANDAMTVGIGGGQTNRVDAARQALERAGKRARGSVLASDAFFPFGDVMELAQQYGVAMVIQPGGSIKDQDSIDVANSAGISLYFTGERHFRH